jgi:hypothetical protein
MSSTANERYQQALQPYLDGGLTLIPLHKWNAEKTVSNKTTGKTKTVKAGKHPLHSQWPTLPYKAAKVAGNRVTEGYNVGVRLSAEELVVDVDPRSGGDKSWLQFQWDHNVNDEAFPRVITGSGGSHFYLRLPPGVKICETLEGYPGIEFKSIGRQVVAAGSRHPNGEFYVWDAARPALDGAPMVPAAMLEVIKRPPLPQGADGANGGEATPEQIAKILAALDPADFNANDIWFPLMCECHHASGGDAREQFIEWSLQDSSYANDEQIIGRRWDTLHRERSGVRTYKSLNDRLRKAGKPSLQIRTSAADDFPDAPDDIEGADDEPSESTIEVLEDENAWTEGDNAKAAGFTVGGLDFHYGSSIRSEAIEWLWRDRIPIGMLTMSVGFPEQGKSLTAADMAARVTKGKAWPNGEGHAPLGAAMILSAEDARKQTLIPRLVAAGANIDQVIIIGMIVKNEKRMMNLGDDLKRLSVGLQRARDDGRNVRLVIIDPISAYMGGKSKGNTWNQSDVRAILAPVAEWAERERVAVMAISHFNKGGNSHMLYRVTDSIGFTAAARAVWFSMPDPDNADEKLFLRGKGSVFRSDVPGLSYKIKAKNVRLDDGETVKIPYIEWGNETTITAEAAMSKPKEMPALDNAMSFLRTLLASGGGEMPVKEIQAAAEAAGQSWATTKRAKLLLPIEHTSAGVGQPYSWRLTDDADAEGSNGK